MNFEVQINAYTFEFLCTPYSLLEIMHIKFVQLFFYEFRLSFHCLLKLCY